MEVDYLITGIVVGFLVAAPVGPVAVMCIQRTLLDGRISGYATGLGAAIADTVFGAFAVFSVALVETFLSDHRPAVQFIGSVVLIGLGLRTILVRHSRKTEEAKMAPIDHLSLLQSTGSAFIVTIVNPITILAFISIFAAIRISATIDGLLGSWTVVLGVMIGALAWWWLLASIASILRHRFTERGLRWLNAVSGAVILGFGVYGLAALLWVMN
jgi:threonine/homoserine/homoserine lactone efflux protein